MMTWTVSLSGQSYHGWCTQGGTNPVTTGVPASQPFIRSFPNCTIGVTSVATGMPATLTDLTGAALSNPFMNSASGNTMTGDYSFVITSGPGAYNVQISAPGLTTYTFRINIGGTTVDCSSFAPPTAGAKLAACIAALPATGGVADATNLVGPQTVNADMFAGIPASKPVTLLLGAATYTVTARQNLSSNNSAVRCQGTTFINQTGPNSSLFNISGSDDIFENCLITGQAPIAGQNLFVMTFSGSNRALFRNNTITNLASYGLYITNATDLRIIDNSIFGVAVTNAGALAIHTSGSAGSVHNLYIENNRIDIPAGSGGEPIQVSIDNITTAADVGPVTVQGNILSTGSGFCAEIGPFDANNMSNAVHDVAAVGNSCTITASGTNGGFSTGGGNANSVLFANNVYNGGGFSAGIAAFEASSINGFAITGNTVRNAASTNCVLAGGYEENGTISGNICHSSGILIQVSTPDCCDRKLSISGNSIELPPAVAATGISVACNNAMTICRNISITGNAVFGDGTANTIGIAVGPGVAGAILDNVVIDGNSVYKAATGYQANGNNLSITNNTYDAGGVAGTGFSNAFGNLTGFNISHNTFTSLNAGALAYTLFGIGLQAGPFSDGVISANQIDGVNLTPNFGAGILLQPFNTATMARITINGNTINAQGTMGSGINVAGRDAGTTMQDILIQGNNLTGDPAQSGFGINYNGPGAQRITVSNNTLRNFTYCIYPGAAVSNIWNNSMSNCALVGFTFTAPNTQVIDFNGITVANVPAMIANGSMIYVTDGTIANPCAGGGTGAILKRLNGINVCN